MTLRLSADNKVVGVKQVQKALDSDEIEILFFAKDADKEVTADIVNTCIQNDVEVVEVETMEELGEACKIDINAAIAALLK